MKRVIGAAVAAIALACAGSASAAQLYQLTLTGTLIAERTDSSATDANLHVGDLITVTARFSADRMKEWGDLGYSVAGFYGLAATGDEFWRIDAPGGLTWRAGDDIYDGWYAYEDFDNYTRSLRIPAVAFQDGKVIGLAGSLSPSYNSSRPWLSLGSSVGYGANGRYPGQETFTAGYFTDTFTIRAPNGLYGNLYQTQGFTGVWDYAGSSITAVPEPATWAIMILGFGLVGSMVRRRREHLVPA